MTHLWQVEMRPERAVARRRGDPNDSMIVTKFNGPDNRLNDQSLYGTMQRKLF